MAIILSPKFKQAYERAGGSKPIISNSKGKPSKRFIRVSLKSPNIDSYRKKIKGDLKLFIASVCHPYETEKYQEFNDKLQALLGQVPIPADKVLGQDINVNVQIRYSDRLEPTIGPRIIDNRSKKGIWALQFMAPHNLRIATPILRMRITPLTCHSYHPAYHMC